MSSCSECVYATFDEKENGWRCRESGSIYEDPYEENECDHYQYPFESCDDCSYCEYRTGEDDDGDEYDYYWCEMHGEDVDDPGCLAPFCYINDYMHSRKIPILERGAHSSLFILKEKLKQEYWRTKHV